MYKVKSGLKRIFSFLLIFAFCFSGVVIMEPVEADAATAGSYYAKLTVAVTDDADGWDVTKITLYYKSNNGTGTQGSVVLVDLKGAVGDGTHSYTATINGFPTGYTFEYSFGGGFTWRTYGANITIEVGANSSSTLKTVFTQSVYDESGAFSAAKGTFGGTSLSMSNKPYAASVGTISGSSSINVPTNGASTSVTYSGGVVKDQYGVNWYQNPTWSVNNSKVSMNSSTGRLTVSPTANAANDYTVTVKAACGSASASKTVTIKTFDYNVTFNDYDGTALDTQTVNYGSSATPPADPSREYDASYHYIFSNWSGSYQNLTSGAQNKTVTAVYTAEAHSFSEVTDTEATCTQEGVMNHICSCGYSYTTPIEATGHTIVTDEAKEPTCTENGYTEGSHCSVCNEVIVAQEEIPATGHTEETIPGYPATCTENGLTDGIKCSVCGATIKEQEVIIAAGHTEETVPGYPATCTENGLTDGIKCSVCGATIKEQEVIIATGHTVVTDKAAAPTCTATGLTEGSHCSVCNEVIVAQEVIPALGHTEETVPGYPATCTENGLTNGLKCSVCGEIIVEQRVIPALGHTEETVPGYPATCTENGLTNGLKCSVCGEIIVEQRVIPALLSWNRE